MMQTNDILLVSQKFNSINRLQLQTNLDIQLICKKNVLFKIYVECDICKNNNFISCKIIYLSISDIKIFSRFFDKLFI